MGGRKAEARFRSDFRDSFEQVHFFLGGRRTRDVLRLGAIRRRTLVLTLLLWGGAPVPSVAQQREPRIEVYGLTGIYSPSVGRERFSPQAGAGILLPVGRRWASVVDFGIGVVPVHRRLSDRFGHDLSPDAVFNRRNPHLPVTSELWTNEATLRPSFARLWRRDRFSFRLGAGIGARFEYNRWRYKMVRQVRDSAGNAIPVDDEEPLGLLAVDEHFTTEDSWSPRMDILGSLGATVNVNKRTVVRFGYVCGFSYSERPVAGGIEFGVGYQF